MFQLDMERRNFQLRYDQLAGERTDLKTEVIRLREKVELLSVEKNMLEHQVVDTVARKDTKEQEEQREEQEGLIMRVWRVEGFRQREIWLSLDGESAGDMMLAFNCRACMAYFALLCMLKQSIVYI